MIIYKKIVNCSHKRPCYIILVHNSSFYDKLLCRWRWRAVETDEIFKFQLMVFHFSAIITTFFAQQTERNCLKVGYVIGSAVIYFYVAVAHRLRHPIKINICHFWADLPCHKHQWCCCAQWRTKNVVWTPWQWLIYAQYLQCLWLWGIEMSFKIVNIIQERWHYWL